MQGDSLRSDRTFWVHCLLLTALAFWISFPNYRALFGVDEGLYYNEAQRMLQGEVIYRDFFEFVTPGVFFFIKWIFQLVGPRVMAVRCALFLLYLAEVGMLFWLARRVLRRSLYAYLPALLFILILKWQSWWSIQHHVLSNFMAVATACLLVCYLDNRKTWLPYLVGLSASVTFCITQHLGALVLALAGLWVMWLIPWLTGGPRARSAGLFCLGVATPILPLVLYLAFNGAIADAWDCVVRWPLVSYRPYEGAEPYFGVGRQWIREAAGRLPAFAAVRQILYLCLVGYGPIVGVLAGLAGLVRKMRAVRQRRAEMRELLDYAVIWSIASALFLSVLPHPTYFAITCESTLTYVFVAEILALGSGLGYRRLLPWVRVWWQREQVEPAWEGPVLHLAVRLHPVSAHTSASWIRFQKGDREVDGSVATRSFIVRANTTQLVRRLSTLPAFVAAGITVLLFIDVADRFLSARAAIERGRAARKYISTPVGRFWSTNAPLIRDLQTVREFVASHTTSADEILVVYHTPHLYSLTERHNATRYSITWPGYHEPAQVAEMVDVISRRQPVVIIMDRSVEVYLRAGDKRLLRYGAENIAREPLLLAVRANYTPVSELENFTLYLPLAGRESAADATSIEGE